MRNKKKKIQENEVVVDEAVREEMAETLEAIINADVVEMTAGQESNENAQEENADASAAPSEEVTAENLPTVEELAQQIRLIEALLFASERALSSNELKTFLPEGTDVETLLTEIQASYEGRGFQLINTADKWSFRTAADLAPYLQKDRHVPRKLTRATVETLAIIAYHQPVTRAEIEEIRGVSVSQGTVDLLLQAGWVKPGRRRETPGRPLTWVTSEEFLSHFGLVGLEALPGYEELKASGLLDKNRPGVLPLGPKDDSAIEMPVSDSESDSEEL